MAISASTLRHEPQTYLDAGFDDFVSKPFRFERVCQCLATLLGVEFETGASIPAPEALTEVPAVALSAELLEKLKTATEFYRVTELEAHIDAVEALGPDANRLAEQLRGLLRGYDMEAILNVLAEVQTE